MASTSNADDDSKVLFEEDTTELKFPKEFENPNCDALLSSEVFLLLEHRRVQNEQKEEIEDMPETFVKTLSYVSRLSRFKNRETIRAVRAVIAAKNLHKFEAAQLANLCPDSAEEAKALIPSLVNKVEDEELEELIKDISSKKSFQ